MNNLQVVNAEIANQAAQINAELYKMFISFCDTKPQTAKTYTVALKSLMAYFEKHDIKAPTRPDIISYRQSLKDENYSPYTISLYMAACRLFFRWTAQEGFYPNIADHIKGAKTSREHSRGYLTSSQVKDLLANTEGESLTAKRDYAILALMINAGLRDIEVSRANIEDLKQSGDRVVLCIQGKGKDDKAAYVVLYPEVERAIREYLKARGNAEPTAPLFVSVSNNSTGNRLTTRSISRIAKNHFQEAGFNDKKLTAHSLRHTAITISLLGGKSAQETQKFARHADISTTFIYAHNLDEMAAKIACCDTIGAAIFG